MTGRLAARSVLHYAWRSISRRRGKCAVVEFLELCVCSVRDGAASADEGRLPCVRPFRSSFGRMRRWTASPSMAASEIGAARRCSRSIVLLDPSAVDGARLADAYDRGQCSVGHFSSCVWIPESYAGLISQWQVPAPEEIVARSRADRPLEDQDAIAGSPSAGHSGRR